MSKKIKLLIIIYFIFMETPHNGYSQAACEYLRYELEAALESENLEKVKSAYYKILNVCGSTIYSSDVEEVYAKKGVSIGFFGDGWFDVILDTKKTGPDKIEYEINEKMTKMQIKEVVEFIPEFNVLILKKENKIGLYSDQLEEIIPADYKDISYVGSGIVILKQLHFDQKLAYSIPHKKFLFEEPADYISNLIKSERYGGYFIVSNLPVQKIINLEGTVLLKNIGSITFLQESKKLIVTTTEGEYLYSTEVEKLTGPHDKIEQIFVNDEVYWFIKDMNGNRDLYNAKLETVFAHTEYERISVKEASPYVLLRKEGQTGIYSLIDQELVFPYQEALLDFLTPQLFGIERENGLDLIDATGMEIAFFSNKKLKVVGAPYGQAFVLSYEKNKKIAVYDLLGKQLLPPKYDNVSYDILSGSFSAFIGKKEYSFNSEGEEIKF